MTSFYVDDMAKSLTTARETKEALYGTREALSKGNFNLVQLITNCKSIMDDIEPDICAKVTKEITSGDVMSKALGIRWCVSSDEFLYVSRPVADVSHVTRRIILSQVASMWDILGLVAPVIIRGKMIFQETTRLKLSWDKPVPDSIADEWRLWLVSLADLNEVRFSRCLIPEEFLDGAAELIHFSDASQSAYGACSYLRIVNKAGQIHVALVMSKARVAPLKQVTIPRLELCAAVEAIRLEVFLKAAYDCLKRPNLQNKNSGDLVWFRSCTSCSLFMQILFNFQTRKLNLALKMVLVVICHHMMFLLLFKYWYTRKTVY